ncbi:MAG: tRNA guanosine(34) transglycosylase Tgt [Gemmatales bacterium]|nr:tRNA guanosine(34) transglycosylase Tgt [Gemmatales bacterium]MCS7160354.1 tRNA guanosine(34) transglycosylase Tgt [Gemmatales bacterium]MDW8175554.1 tRNA guanosine(34) transglycosylase Tgt [Gemmatales bacterium]MDW8221318.1 tRNA guanosine(34) transglycosylase Tgt [Gemmatales bacterium]
MLQVSTPKHVITFEVVQWCGAARLGRLTTPHGVVETPAFMPVGTQATVKGLLPEQLRQAGVQMLLANTYHLALRPGAELIAQLGGLHRFMGWAGPILTDSGGYQVFSLAAIRRISDHGVEFRSHVDGSLLELTPERAVEIQELLGSDIAMCLDECPPYGASETVLREAVRRTIHWAERCRQAQRRSDQALFGIVQGGLFEDLRRECAQALVGLDFPGYALGGFSVGEPPVLMYPVIAMATRWLPENKPRYLMGVGRPQDILEAVSAGIDLFDCVLPTRNGRNGQAFVPGGVVRIRNAVHRSDPRPLQEDCPCPVCREFSRAYLHHLFHADEMLGPILLSLHNITFYQRFMKEIREAIAAGQLAQYRASRLAQYRAAN